MSKFHFTRRQALGTALTTAAMLADGLGQAAEVSPRQRRQPRGLELSCASLAFSDMSWEEALAAIKKLGFRCIDLAMFEGWTHLSPSQLTEPEAHGRRIAAVCAKLAVEPIAIHTNFAIGDRRKFPGLTTPDPQLRKTILEHFDRVLTCARVAEVPLVNLQPGRWLDKEPRKNCLANALELLRPMQERAAKHGIVLSFENHTGSIGERPEDCLTLLEGAPGLKLDYDFSHVVACGLSLEQTRPLWPYVAHVGVRNARQGSYNEPVRDGRMDFDLAAFVAALRQAKVNAYVSVEYYQPEMRVHVAALKKVLENCQITSR